MSEAPLARLLADRIRASGPIGVDAFMATALGDPHYGYYRTRDPLGRGGDFTTAPEISQIFGELIGAWCAVVWQSMGEPLPCHLVEFGPGRGTLMADALRVFRLLPRARSAPRVHLIETSPVLRQAQAETLQKQHSHIRPKWHERLETVPAGPALYIGNEFFDALPVRQWVKRGGKWVERCVGLGSDSEFIFVDGAVGTLPMEPPLAAEGDIFETNDGAAGIALEIGQRLSAMGGAALFIDYGHETTTCGDTLQAIRAHRYASVLDEAGQADLTTHVDFEALGKAFTAGGAEVFGPVTQAEFLMSLGAPLRAQRLAQGKEQAAIGQIMSGLNRLVHPGAMGRLFKVIGAASPALSDLPGLPPRSAVKTQ